MTGWTALVPLKMGPTSKSRLTPALSAQARETLALRMARHVIDRLGRVPDIDRILLLSPAPVAALPVEWIADGGRGLNGELAAAARGIAPAPLAVIFADLPLLEVADIRALLDAASARGAAIAPDRHGGGTNALALRDPTDFTFAYGADSFARHSATATAMAVVRRPGLAHDLDTPDDLLLLDHALPR